MMMQKLLLNTNEKYEGNFKFTHKMKTERVDLVWNMLLSGNSAVFSKKGHASGKHLSML